MTPAPPCRKCGGERTPQANGRTVCRTCNTRRATEWSKANRERSNQIKAKYRDANKDKAAEYRAANAERLRASKHEYYLANRELWRERNARGYRENREARLAAGRAWMELNREEMRAYQREYYLANRSLVVQRAREYYEQNHAAIREKSRANPDTARAANQLRRARELEAVCEHGPKCVSRAFLAEIRRQRCAYCGAPGEHADHAYPISRAGLHCVENIVSACRPCNQSKTNRDLDEWLRNGRLID